jgi:4-amino-4-deoxy-L-arabinose transferase-like glycosyltransferase
MLCLIVLLGAALRFYQLGTTPHGLYFDEASIGYNALLIDSKGIDEHGVSYPLWFAAFGEYKMPVYIYLTAIAVSLLGPTTFAVRVVSALFGTLTIIVFFFLVKELSRKSSQPYKDALPYVASLLLALSSWHLQFSHAGFEATVAAFLYLTGLLCSLLFWRTRRLWPLLLAALSFVLTLYTYDGYRPLTPLTIALLSWLAIWQERKLWKLVVCVLLLFGVASIPIALFNLSPSGLARFSQVSAFHDFTNLPLWQQLIFIPATYLRNYLSYFSFGFLFGNGDGIARHQPVGFGTLLYWQLPFLLLGLLALVKTKQSVLKLTTFFLFLLAPLAAATALPSPHTLRSLLMVFPLCMIVGVGMLASFKVLRRYPVIIVVCLALISYETIRYFHIYYGQYTTTSTIDWGGEFAATTARAQALHKEYRHIVVSSEFGFAAPDYFGYYSQDKLHPLMADKTWHKPAAWGNDAYLFITPHPKKPLAGEKLETIYLPNNNHDTFAELWRMP